MPEPSRRITVTPNLLAGVDLQYTYGNISTTLRLDRETASALASDIVDVLTRVQVQLGGANEGKH